MKILLKPVFIIAIVAVAMIGVMVPSAFAIASFVDQTKDPQHYIDRYNNEPAYKEWFDENYPHYASIYEAVGIVEQSPPVTSSVIVYAKADGTIIPIIATATIAMMNTDFNSIFNCTWYLVDQLIFIRKIN